MYEASDLNTELIGKSSIKNNLIGSFCNFKILCAFDFAFYSHRSVKTNFRKITKIVTKSPYITFFSDPEAFICGEEAFHMLMLIRKAVDAYYYKFFCNRDNIYNCKVKGIFDDIEYYYNLNISRCEKYNHSIKMIMNGRPIDKGNKSGLDVDWAESYIISDLYYLRQITKNALSLFQFNVS